MLKPIILPNLILLLLFIPLVTIAQLSPGTGTIEKKGDSFIFYNNRVEINSANKETFKIPPALTNRAVAPGAAVRQFRTTAANGTIVLYITVTDPSCGYNTGSIVVQAANGTAPYTYSIRDQYNYVTTRPTGNFPLLNAQSSPYTVTVTDADGNSASAIVVIKDLLPPVLGNGVTFVYPSNCTSADGSFTILAAGGKPPYQYSIDGINYSSSPTFTNLFNGVYVYYIKDANGCMGSGGALIAWNNQNCTKTFGVGHTSIACVDNGKIDVNLPDNGGPYSYSLDGVNYQSSDVFENLKPGVYNIWVKDATGQLLQVFGINIPYSCFLFIDYIAVDAACGVNDGELTVSASLGTPPYTYSIDGVNFQASNVFTGLAPGNYAITVKDATGFTQSKEAIVYNRCPVVRTAVTATTCGNSDGVITAAGFKGTAPYLYSIDGVTFQSNNVFTALATGSYTITLKDANGFTATTTATVDDGCLPFTLTGSNTTCGNNNGAIVVTPAGGTAPYQYSLDGVNFQAANSFTNLAAKTYTVTVKDAGGKIAAKPITLADAAGPAIDITTQPVSCAGNDGVVTVSQVGGTAPYQYSRDGINYQPGNIFRNLAAGTTITFYVKDANGCVASISKLIPVNCPSISVSTRPDHCQVGDGIIAVAGNNGTSPYTFSIDGITFHSTAFFAGLKTGNYTVTIKDALGYTNSTTAFVDNTCPTVTATGTNGACGTANASITASGANGVAPYSYSIDGINFQSSAVFSGLPDGTYTVTVKDADGLQNSTQVTVTNYPSPQLTTTFTNASCLNNDAVILITATGGTAPLQYSVDGLTFQPDPVFSNRASGNYTAVVKDANGCITTALVTVGVNDNLALSATADQTICEGTAVVLATVSNGARFNWTPAAGLNNASISNPLASPSVTTRYYVTATLGVCSKNDSVLVSVNAAPVAVAGADVTVCYGQDVPLNGNGGIQYNWSPSTYLDDPLLASPLVKKPLTTITYSLEVRDANGCWSLNDETVTVTVTPMAKVFAGNDTSIAIGEPLPLNAVDVNNSGFNNYVWSPAYGLTNAGIADPVATLDRDIKYIVTAKTPAGCEGNDDIVIKVFKAPEIFVPNMFTPNKDGRNDFLKAIPVGIKTFHYFRVYNRWGKQVFSTKDAAIGWDGSINGVDQNMQLLTWVAEGTDFRGNKIFRKGTVILLR